MAQGEQDGEETALYRILKTALAGVVKWLECWPLHQRVEGSIPGQGYILGLQVQSPARVGEHAGGN